MVRFDRLVDPAHGTTVQVVPLAVPVRWGSFVAAASGLLPSQLVIMVMLASTMGQFKYIAITVLINCIVPTAMAITMVLSLNFAEGRHTAMAVAQAGLPFMAIRTIRLAPLVGNHFVVGRHCCAPTRSPS